MSLARAHNSFKVSFVTEWFLFQARNVQSDASLDVSICRGGIIMRLVASERADVMSLLASVRRNQSVRHWQFGPVPNMGVVCCKETGESHFVLFFCI